LRDQEAEEEAILLEVGEEALRKWEAEGEVLWEEVEVGVQEVEEVVIQEEEEEVEVEVTVLKVKEVEEEDHYLLNSPELLVPVMSVLLSCLYATVFLPDLY
jgi:hypothetical protein